MLKKINKVLVSVIIVASIMFFIFADGSKFIMPIMGYHNSVPKQEQKHSPPTNETKSNKNTSPPSSNSSVGAEQTIKKEVKKPAEKSIKDIHNEVKHEIKHNTMKFKINPAYKIKPMKPVIPKMGGIGGKAKLIRVLVP